MRWAQEAYDRLKWQEANRPDPAEVQKLTDAQERDAVNAKIKRGLPKVA